MSTSEIPQMKCIAHLRGDLPTKFGIPRQSGLAENLTARIVFEPEYRNADALRGIEGFSHLWLVWLFSKAVRDTWSPTVRPPRLGGNARMGVFATRSPFRPNAIGLSSVKLVKFLPETDEGPVLIVSGADLMDGTPILDIKPYLAYTDSHPDAVGGFTDATTFPTLDVVLPEEAERLLGEDRAAALRDILSQDPRPQYHNDPERVYGFEFAGHDISFNVADGKLFVREIK